MVHRVISNDNECQRMTTSDNEWHRVVQRMITSETTSDTTSNNEWQRMTASNKK